ncbi:MAG: Dabb family protein [Bacteriovorax sp.]
MKKLFLVISAAGLFTINAMAEVSHFVAFKYKPSVTAEQKQTVIKRFLDLKNLAIRNGSHYIISIETGKGNSREGADQGMEQGFIVKFKNESDRDYYVGKPFTSDFDQDHDEFKQFVGPLLATDKNGKINGVFVFDFTTK